MLNLAQPYIMLEEKLNTCFDNSTSAADTSSNFPSRKESHRQKEDADRGMYGRKDKYILLNTIQNKIYRECANTEFRKAGIWHHFPIQESTLTDKSKYYQIHKGHNTSFDDCVQLKDPIEIIVNKGRLSEYVMGGRQDREESLKTKSHIKVSKTSPIS